MKKRIKLSLITILSVGLIQTSISADSMKTYANGVTITKISGSDGNGGSFKMNFPQMTLKLADAKAPSFKSGCGGVDITFGSIQFLDKEKIVQFLEATLSNAAGVAFDLAMKAACEECSETLKSLEAMANAINNMSLDSCQAATSLVSATGLSQQAETESAATAWIKSKTKNVLGYLEYGQVQNYLDNLGANAPKIAKFLNKNQTTDDSLAYYLLKGGPMEDETELLTELGGNIFINTRPAGEVKGSFYFDMYKNDSDIRQIVRFKIGGEGTESLTSRDVFHHSVGPQTEEQLVKEFMPKIQKISDNIIQGRAHSNDDLAFLNSLNAPIYKIFNLLARIPEARATITGIEDKLAKVFAAETMYQYMSKYQYTILKETYSYSSLETHVQSAFGYDDVQSGHTIVNALNKMISQINLTMKEINNVKVEAYRDMYDEIIKNEQAFSAINKIRTSVLLSRNPDILTNINTMKTLQTQANGG